MSKRLRIILAGVLFVIVGFLFVVILSPAKNLVLDPSAKPQDDSATDTKTHTLLFAGDIMLTRNVGKQISYHNDWRYPFLLIASTTRQADLAFANLESQISSRGRNQGSIYSFRADPRVIEGLSYAGFDVLSTVNNHSLDYGRDALVDTIDLLKQAGIASVGTGRNTQEANAPYIATLGDTKIALLAYTSFYPESVRATADSAGISSFVPEVVFAQIKELKTQADIIIVSFHAGDEYQTTSHPREQEIYRSFIDAGADLVIGHHPHVVQEIERYEPSVPVVIASEGEAIQTAPSTGLPRRLVAPRNDSESDKHFGYIAYSLGNFVFDQDFSEATMQGMMVEAVIKDKKIVEFNKIPIKLTPTFQPYLSE